MIIYAQNRAFPHKTFVTAVHPKDKVARVRAQLLHILYNLGKDDHLFRLRYKGQILRDGFSMQDYDIPDNAVVTMVPIGKSHEVMMDIHSVHSSEVSYNQHSQLSDIKNAVEAEVKTFDRREQMVADFKALLYLHCVFTFLAVLSTYWYSIFWLAFVLALALWFVPTYSRIGGFVGNTSHLKSYFCIFGIILSVACLIPSLYFCISGWIFVGTEGCSGWTFDGQCSHLKIYTAALFTLHVVLLIFTIIFIIFLARNFGIEVGDFIERALVQEREIDKVLMMAQSGQIKDQRAAVYDLAGIATSSDDNKFRIVAEGGLSVLTRLALSRDEITQEHAVEALTELLTIPSIQDTFMENDGIGNLTALLCSSNSRVMQEAAVAVYNIVANSEENKHDVVKDNGLDDLCHAANEGTIFCQRTIASIFLELVFNADVRAQIASRTKPAQALVSLCKSNDPDTVQFALQSLEVLAIESSDLICAQEDLVGLLLDLPFRSMDEKLYLLAGKILLYIAENEETCKAMLDYPRARDSLSVFGKCLDPILQKVVVKIIACTLEYTKLREKVLSLDLEETLEFLRDFSTDQEVMETATQCLTTLSNLKAQKEKGKKPLIPQAMDGKGGKKGKLGAGKSKGKMTT